MAITARDITTIHRFATDLALSSPDHGPRHWRDVARVGIALFEQRVAADLEVLLVFAATHDTQRQNEFSDPEHGERAASLVEELHRDGKLAMTQDQIRLLLTALRGHDRGETTRDTRVGACWDADRLTLWRVGITPDSRFLSTPQAQAADLEFPAFGRRVVTGPDLSWEEIVEAYQSGTDRSHQRVMNGTSRNRSLGDERPTYKQGVLWGRDHTELGEIVARSLSPDVAIAISKGKQPKTYHHTDPNEDAVAAVVSDRGKLLVCADGHSGFDSVHEAVTVVLDRLGNGPALEEISIAGIISAFGDAHEAVVRVTGANVCVNPESRTTLVVGVVAGRRLRWAAMGDSALLVASPSEARRLDRPQSRFLGWPAMTREGVPEALESGECELRPGSWVVLGSDGFIDFARRPTPEEALWNACSDAAASLELAHALVDLAFKGNAGDNIGIVVAGPIG